MPFITVIDNIIQVGKIIKTNREVVKFFIPMEGKAYMGFNYLPTHLKHQLGSLCDLIELDPKGNYGIIIPDTTILYQIRLAYIDYSIDSKICLSAYGWKTAIDVCGSLFVPPVKSNLFHFNFTMGDKPI